MRTLLAFIIAPVVTPLVFLITAFLRNGFVLFGDVAGLLLLVLLYAYGAEVLFGIPAWLFFKRNRVTSWAYLLIGTVIGVIVFLIVGGNPTSIDWLSLGVPCVAAAAASGGTFRLIIVRTIPIVPRVGYSADSSP